MSEPNDGWHLDKRISISHIVATLVATGAILTWLFALQERVSVTEVKTEQNTAGISKLENRIVSQYDEINRKLERIEDRLNTKRTD